MCIHDRYRTYACQRDTQHNGMNGMKICKEMTSVKKKGITKVLETKLSYLMYAKECLYTKVYIILKMITQYHTVIQNN